MTTTRHHALCIAIFVTCLLAVAASAFSQCDPPDIFESSPFVLATNASATSYEWYENGAQLSGETESSITLSPFLASEASNKDYYVVAHFADGCSATSEVLSLASIASCASQQILNEGLRQLSGGGNAFGQSFTVSGSSDYQILHQIQVESSSSTARTITPTVTIYVGDGPSGQAIFSQYMGSFTWPSSANFATFNLTNGPVLTKGVQYTFIITTPSFSQSYYHSRRDEYSGGRRWAQGQANDDELVFTLSTYQTPTVPSPTIAIGDVIADTPVLLTATGTDVSTYQWYKDGVALVDENASTFSVAVGNEGVYSVDGLNSAGCGGRSGDAVVDIKGPVFTSAATQDVEEGEVEAYLAVATDLSDFSYSLGDTGDEALFSLDSETGEVSFLSAPVFDDLGSNSYTITVQATDTWLNVSSLEVSINIVERFGPPNAACDGILMLDGVDDKVIVPFNANLNPSEFTISCWVRPARQSNGDASDYQSPITTRESSFSGYLFYQTPQDQWSFWTGSGANWSTLDASTGITVGEWYYLTGTHDGSTMKFYVNGELAGSRNSTFVANVSADLFIGAGADGSTFYFEGAVDNLALWDYARTAEQIAEDMVSSYEEMTEGGVVSTYYSFDEGVGSTLYDLAGGHHGTLTNMELPDSWVDDEGNAMDNVAQTVSFEALSDVTLGAGSFEMAASTDAGSSADGFEIQFTSSDESVATISGNTLSIAGAGSVTISAVEMGGSIDDVCYSPAAAAQTINVAIPPPNETCGTVLNFDGVNEYVQASPVNFQNDAVTLEAYYKGSSLQSAVRIQNGSTYLVLGHSANAHYLSWESPVTLTASVPAKVNVNDGEWHHIAVTWKRNDPNGFVSYVDGQVQASRASQDVPMADLSSIDLFLGSYLGSSEFLNGALDEVRIWNVALTQEQIVQNILVGIDDDAEGLLHYYDFNEGAGATLVDLAGSNDGTLTNMDPATDWTDNDGNALAEQALTFEALDEKVFGDAAFDLEASSDAGTAGEGFSITFESSNQDVASIDGNTVTLLGAGTATITAVQMGGLIGDVCYDFVSTTRTLTVAKATQSISFNPLAAATFGDDPIALEAGGGASGNSVTFTSSNTDVATVEDGEVTIVGAGETVITASQLGNDDYEAAEDVEQTLVVNKAAQTIVFDALAEQNLVQTTEFDLEAIGGASGEIITYSSSDPEVATVEGATVTLLAVGQTTITANQAGNDNYEPATASQELVVVEEYIWDGATWNGAGMPPSNVDLRIEGDLVLDDEDPLQAKNLEVAEGVTVTVSEQHAIVVNEDLTLEGTVVVNSGGALALFGQVSGEGSLTTQRSVTPSLGYSMVGSTVGSMQLSSIDPVPNFIYDFDGVDFVVPNSLESGKGYFVAYEAVEPVFSLSGRPTAGAVEVSLNYSANGDNSDDFTILANPYNAAISLADFQAENYNGLDGATDGVAYFWQDGGANNADGTRAGSYLTVNAVGDVAGGSFDGYVRSGQGFFVRALQNANVAFEADWQVTTADSNGDDGFFRATNTGQLRIALSQEAVSDALLIGFYEDATLGLDIGLDAHKRMNTGLSAYSFSEKDQQALAIQALPEELTAPLLLPLGIRNVQDGVLEISADFSQLNNEVAVYLLDRQEDLRINLTNSYSTTVEQGSHSLAEGHRFVLEFAPVPTALSTTEVPSFAVLGNTHNLYIRSGEVGTKWVTIQSIDGKTVFKEQVTFDGKGANVYPALESKSIYLIQVGTQSIKFTLR